MVNDSKKQAHTSWQHAGEWYSKLVDRKGHYYHQHVIIPGVLRLLSLKPDSALLDLACGQGVLGRQIPKKVYYQGIDIASSLMNFAIKEDKMPDHFYTVSDVTIPLPIIKNDFTHATIILALQNIANPEMVMVNAREHLQVGGKLVIVINHPCFRIPRQSSWEIDQKNKLQYRRINRYLTPLTIPITQHPGKQNRSPITWSFHYPLSSYSAFLYKNGFIIEKIEEWISDKTSVGKAAKMENRSRMEFPLFMAILAQKIK